TDRGRPGVKHHLLVDANGIPLAGEVTGANKPDAAGTLPLVDSAGPLDPEGEDEGPGGRPGELYGDRAYDAEALRDELRERDIEPKLAKRRTPHGSGLGKVRWVVERTIGWLHNFRKLRVVTEKTQEMQLALLNLGLSLICFNYFCNS
ncbi:transposase, partial [Zavarzinella formosa]|uniref:transposase n=2 Tax=Zavarzinella formosa TaxID=360055 RepID=UPI0012FB005E